jgi:putative SOS response-associated peptidase YedK
MCGKFTAMASWRGVHDFSTAIGTDPPTDATVAYRPMTMLPVIIFDKATNQRLIVPMRWGFPHPKDWKRPQPIHARAEGIHNTKAFAEAFHGGQRGIVVFKTFNEGLELANGKTEQWTIDPSDGVPRGFAFVWRRFELPDNPVPLFAACMVTVPPSDLVQRIPAERMPVILAGGDWTTWLGESEASTDEVLATLKTVEGVNWQVAPEPKAEKKPSSKKR